MIPLSKKLLDMVDSEQNYLVNKINKLNGRIQQLEIDIKDYRNWLDAAQSRDFNRKYLKFRSFARSDLERKAIENVYEIFIRHEAGEIDNE